MSQQSFGQKAVGLSFNPSGDAGVTQCKQHFATAIDQMNDLRNSTSNPEVKRMAQLLNEWDEHWDSDNCPPEQLIVSAKIDNKFTSMPSWLKDYRLWHPDKINACFASKHIKNGATNEQV